MVRPYERLGVVPLATVMKAIADGKPFEYEGVICGTKSPRLLTYLHHGVQCCVPGCSVRGEYFAVERATNQKGAKFHLNLYYMKDGIEIMVTSDHRIPKSLGGSNHVKNRQPMCEPHNHDKGNQLIYT